MALKTRSLYRSPIAEEILEKNLGLTASGSAHNKSQTIPLSGTEIGLEICRICKIYIFLFSPPWYVSKKIGARRVPNGGLF